MPTWKGIKIVIGLCFRGCGWVFVTIGVLLLLRWLLFKLSQWAGQVHSAPLDLYGMVGALSLIFGLACFWVTRWLLAAGTPNSVRPEGH